MPSHQVSESLYFWVPVRIAFIPVLGCFSGIGAVVIQGAEAWEQAAGAVGASGLGICSGADESALPHSPQIKLLFYFFFGLDCLRVT